MKDIIHIIGLGNPNYDNSPHNLGFMFIDRMLNFFPRKKKSISNKREIYEVENNNKKLYLSKPRTFVNLSGDAIVEVFRSNNFSAEELLDRILVVHDEVGIDMFKIRYIHDLNAGAGGHNGIRSIVNSFLKLGVGHDKSKFFRRIRLGCNSPHRQNVNLDKYVLSPMNYDLVTEWKFVIDEYIRTTKLIESIFNL